MPRRNATRYIARSGSAGRRTGPSVAGLTLVAISACKCDCRSSAGADPSEALVIQAWCSRVAAQATQFQPYGATVPRPRPAARAACASARQRGVHSTARRVLARPAVLESPLRRPSPAPGLRQVSQALHSGSSGHVLQSNARHNPSLNRTRNGLRPSGAKCIVSPPGRKPLRAG